MPISKLHPICHGFITVIQINSFYLQEKAGNLWFTLLSTKEQTSQRGLLYFFWGKHHVHTPRNKRHRKQCVIQSICSSTYLSLKIMLTTPPLRSELQYQNSKDSLFYSPRQITYKPKAHTFYGKSFRGALQLQLTIPLTRFFFDDHLQSNTTTNALVDERQCEYWRW